MKRILLLLTILIWSIVGFAQTSPVLTIRVVNLTTAFGSPVPFNYVISAASDTTKWQVVNVNGLVGTETITSALAAGTIIPVPSKIKGSTQISVTGTNGHLVLTVPDATITNAKLANMVTKTFKGRTSTGTGVPEDLSVSTVKTDLSLNNVDNTSDANKPISTATQAALDLKRNIADTVALKGTATIYDLISKADKSTTITATAPITIDGTTSADLSANRTIAIIPATTSVPGSMSAADKTKLDGIAAGAGTGTVTSITMGTGLTGGTITTTGTGAIDTTFVAKKTTVAAMYLPKRTFGTAANSATTDFTPASGSANYIQNQNSAAQTANMWINGSGNFGNDINITSNDKSLFWTAAGNYVGIKGVSGNMYLYTGTDTYHPALVLGTNQSSLFYNSITTLGTGLYFGNSYHGITYTTDENILKFNEFGGVFKFYNSSTNTLGATIDNGVATFAGTSTAPPFVTVSGDGAGGTSVKGFQIKSGGTLNAVNTYDSATGENRIGGVQSYVFPTFYSGNAEAMRISTNGNVTINSLASTYARLTSTSPTGQLTAIADGTAGQFLKTDAVGGHTWAGLGDAKLTYGSSNTFSNDRDIVDKAYVDAVASGNLPKLPVDAAATGNITLSGASQTIDGFAAIAGTRILVWKQAIAYENGVYVVASGAWTRATDLDTWAELYKAYVAVIEGYQNGSSFVCTIPSSGTLETTDVTWVLYNVPTNILAGSGLTKTGSTISLNTATSGAIGGIIAGAGITMTGSTASVSTAYDATGTSAIHAALTTTAHGLGASAFHADSYFLTPTGSAASLTSFPTLNQNTTGTSASFTGSLVGEVTGTQGATVVGNAAVIAKVLTGYVSGAGTVAATDNILQAIQKLNGNAAASTHNPVTIGTANGLSLSTQALSMALAATGTTGALSSTDWNTFNGKLSTNGSAANLTSFPTLNQSTTGTASNVSGIVLGANGGTGIANTGKTITLGGNFTTSGAYASTFTMTGTTGVTFPTSGTLATTAQITGTNSGTNTGDVNFIIDYFAETATSSSYGAYHTLAHTPINTSTGIQVIYNGTPLPATNFTYSAGTVRVTGQVYQYDKLAISYLY